MCSVGYHGGWGCVYLRPSTLGPLAAGGKRDHGGPYQKETVGIVKKISAAAVSA